jgi:hypothetical protein
MPAKPRARVQRGAVQSRDLRDLVYWNRAGVNRTRYNDPPVFVVVDQLLDLTLELAREILRVAHVDLIIARLTPLYVKLAGFSKI